MSDAQVLEQNPWWRGSEALRNDPYLRRFHEGPLRWDPPVLDAISLDPGAVHTLRGPRQVGKSTTVKRLIERLVTGVESRVAYYSFDLARDPEDIVEVIRAVRRLHPHPHGVWHWFFDEVTTVPDWQSAIKYAVDQGLVADDFVLCTGSSARLLAPETLPGRRGAGHDFVQLPISFRDFCVAACGLRLPPATFTPNQLLDRTGSSIAKEIHLEIESLRWALGVYQRVGGFPAAVHDYMTAGSVSNATLTTLWSIVADDVRRAGRDSVGALKLLEGVTRSLSSHLSWESLAEAMDTSPNTAREYVGLLSSAFILLTVHFWAPHQATPNARKQRKVYFMDPLLASVASFMAASARVPEEPAIVENLVAVGLFRSATDRLVQAEPTPGAVGVWRSSNGREIDFVIEDRAAGGSRRLPVEVKGDNRANISRARQSIRKTFGQGLVVTNSVFEPEADVPAIPVAVLLPGLADRPVRVPVAE